MRRILSAVAVLAILAGCGGGGGGNKTPEPTFRVDADLDGAVYTYRIGTTTFGCTYEPNSELALCIISAPGVNPFAFFGPVSTDGLTIFVQLSAFDSDGDGDFLEELSLPVASGSRVDFADDGSSVTVDVTLNLDPSNPQRLFGVGDLISTGGTSASMRTAMRLAEQSGIGK